MQGNSVYLAGLSRQSSCNCLTARIWSLFDRLAFQKVPFGLAWIVHGSARFCSFFRSYLHMIREESSTTAPSSQSSRNTSDEGDQVAYNAYFVYICIFYKNLHISSLYAYFLTWPVELCRMARQGELEDGL